MILAKGKNKNLLYTYISDLRHRNQIFCKDIIRKEYI